MTYESLEKELLKEFNPSKIKANKEFIEAIVRIVTTDENASIALDIAESKMKEANDKYSEALKLNQKASNYMSEYNHKNCELNVREKKLEARENEIERFSETIKQCETKEARDKLRIAYNFKIMDDEECFDEARVRAFSNILGNGGKIISTKEETK